MDAKLGSQPDLDPRECDLKCCIDLAVGGRLVPPYSSAPSMKVGSYPITSLMRIIFHTLYFTGTT